MAISASINTTETRPIPSSHLVEKASKSFVEDGNLKALFNAFLHSRLALGYTLTGASFNADKSKQPKMYAKLDDLLKNSPDFFDPSERIFAIQCVKTKACPESSIIADSIRKLLNNRNLRLHLFGLVNELKFRISFPTQLSKEVAYFPALSRIYFNWVQGSLRGPVDLTQLKNLKAVDITGSGLQITDLQVTHRILVFDTEHPRGIELAPPVKSQTCVIL